MGDKLSAFKALVSAAMEPRQDELDEIDAAAKEYVESSDPMVRLAALQVRATAALAREVRAASNEISSSIGMSAYR